MTFLLHGINGVSHVYDKTFNFVIITLIFSSILLDGISPLILMRICLKEMDLLVDNIIKQSYRSTNDWSASGNAANPAVMNSVDTSSNNEIVVSGIISGSTTMTMGSTSVTSVNILNRGLPKLIQTELAMDTKFPLLEPLNMQRRLYKIFPLLQTVIFSLLGCFKSQFHSVQFLTSTGYWDCWTAKLSSNGQWQVGSSTTWKW